MTLCIDMKTGQNVTELLERGIYRSRHKCKKHLYFCAYIPPTIRFHAHIQALLIAAVLAHIARGEGDDALRVAAALVLHTVALLHSTPEETLEHSK